MSLEKEIADVITKNLPEEIGRNLKSRLEQAEKDANDLRDLRYRVEEKNKQILELNSRIRKENDLERRKQELDKSQREQEKKQYEIEKKEAIVDVMRDLLSMNNQNMTNLVSLVFQNRWKIQESITKNTPVTNAGSGYPQTYQQSQTEHKITEGEGPQPLG